MKTCHVCGCFVDDGELVCPECGATVVKSTGGLSLKQEEPEKKKKTNPIGMTVSTGSGLTDILKAGDYDEGEAEADPFNGGSIPVSMSKNIIEDDEPVKKKSGNVFGVLFKIVIFAAIAFGIYYLITNVILKKEGADTYEAALDMYIEALNDNDAQAMSEIVPSYMSDATEVAQSWIDSLNGANISEYSISRTDTIDDNDLTFIEEEVKLERNKVVDIREGVTLIVDFRGVSYNNAGNSVNRGGELKMQFIKIENRWYFYPEEFDSSLLTK